MAATGSGTNRIVVMPSERSADIQAHWAARRQHVRDRDERRADDEEQRVRTLREDLAIENLFSIGSALVRESQAALAAGAPALAVHRCKLAVEVAPALVAAHTCLARALMADSIIAVKPAVLALVAAGTAALSDPRASRAALANLLSMVFVGLLVTTLGFAVVVFLRYANLYAHDVHHLFPGGVRGWQTRMLAALLLLLPVLLQMGPIPLLFTTMLAFALYASTAEVAISILLLGCLAASPYAAEQIGRVAAFGGPALDVWLVEHGEGTGSEIGRLQKRFESGNELAVDFALARKAKRDGDLAAAEKLYLRALEVQGASSAGLAMVRNNLGNLYLLQGDTARAIAQYQQAVDLKEDLAAPHFNVSRALAMGGVETLEKVQAEQARALALDRAGVEAFTGGQLQANRKSNKFVMDVSLDAAQLEPLIEAEQRAAAAVADEVRVQLAGGLPDPLGSAMPVGAAILLLGLHMARGRIRPSGRCDRCGREVCKRCDSDARPSEGLCAQCVNVFIRRTGVDPSERVRKEFAVEAYHRRRRLLARVFALLSGAGQVMMGYPIRGFVFMAATASLLASIVFWRGVAHDPLAVNSGISFARVGLTSAVLIGVYAICLRDLLARQRAEEGA
jgi:tetratricopeptide (TPR) repeat protein